MRNMPPLSPAAQEDAPRHLLGTDPLGRDILSRIIFGARVSLTVGLSSALVSGIIGTLLGIIAGYYRGKADDIIMRLVDIQMSIPVIMLALLVLFSLGPGFWNLVVVLAIVRWMAYARLATRADPRLPQLTVHRRRHRHRQHQRPHHLPPHHPQRLLASCHPRHTRGGHPDSE